MGTHLHVIYCFSLVAFKFFSLCLSLLLWLICALTCSSLGLSWNRLLDFLNLGYYFLSHVTEVINYNLFKYFLRPFLYFSSSGTPIIWMLMNLLLSQWSLKLSSFPFIFFLYSIPQQQLPPSWPPSHLSVFLPQLFSYWSLLVYFTFQLLLCSSEFVPKFI